MKKFAALLLFCIPLITNAQSVENDIIGKWKAFEQGGNEITFIFDKAGFAFMGYEDMLVGGESYETEAGDRMRMTYTLDTKQSPMFLDLVMESLTDDRKLIMPMIFELVDKDHLKLLGETENTRPKEFTEEALIFERVE
ncbi:MAG: hypothetical protein KDC56_02880 [Flavobacteriaceae bacterium]|nr:hypothetical protein [Flavobacteriaceae bacterium]